MRDDVRNVVALDTSDGDERQGDVGNHPIKIIEGYSGANVLFGLCRVNGADPDIVRTGGHGRAGLIRGMGGQADDHVRADETAHGLDGEFPGEEPVVAELLTARTMLVPEEVLGTGDAGTLLAANGMAPAAEERAVCSLPVQGIVAVMAAHREALRQAEEKLGDRILYTTPLLREVQAGTPTVWAYRTAGLLYIKVYDGILRFAGVIPAPDTADVCYFTERLEKEFALKSCELRISGDDAKACGKLLKGYFKRIVCE